MTSRITGTERRLFINTYDDAISTDSFFSRIGQKRRDDIKRVLKKFGLTPIKVGEKIGHDCFFLSVGAPRENETRAIVLRQASWSNLSFRSYSENYPREIGREVRSGSWLTCRFEQNLDPTDPHHFV